MPLCRVRTRQPKGCLRVSDGEVLSRIPKVNVRSGLPARFLPGGRVALVPVRGPEGIQLVDTQDRGVTSPSCRWKNEHRNLAVSPNGKLVITCRNEDIHFWRIKLPYLQGTVRTAAMLSIIGSLRYFDLVYVMTGGGPEGASELMATYMYRTVFSSYQLGYGSTIASAMFLIVVLIAALGMRLTKRFETEV